MVSRKYFLSAAVALSAVYAQVPERDLPAAAQAMAHFSANAQSYGLTDAANQLSARKSSRDEQGVAHIRYDQKFRGIRVFEGEAIAHVTPGGQVTVTDSLAKGLSLADTTPRVGRGAALATAIRDLKVAGSYDLEYADLEILPKGQRSATERLVWHFRVGVENETDAPGRWDAFIDAVSGAVVWKFDSLETAASVGTGNTMYSGVVGLSTDSSNGTYYLRDLLRSGNETRDMRKKQAGAGTLVDDPGNFFGDGSKSNTDPDTAAADAHFGMTMTWDYFKNTHARNGIDGAGRKTYSRVHYGRNYQNAFWSDSCFCMTYGDGGSTFYPLVSIDVAGHEMSHGVTSKEANLTYSGESGGLNEATSDIFGTLVEYDAISAQDGHNYWIGERIYRSNYSTGSYVPTKALRYMDDPSKDGRSPACWSSGLGSLDVHYSSGPANHMFYLLSNGGTSKCNGAVVGGIGRTDAGKIWYKALADYMTSSTNYAAARTAAINASTALFGTASAQTNAVKAAFSAINVN